MSTKLTRLAVVIAAVAGVSNSAFAIDPVSIPVIDGVRFTPTLQFQEKYDDNIFATKKQRQSSWVTVIEPTFSLSLDRAKSAYQLKYRMSSNNYHSSNDSSHINHHITADTGFAFDSRNRLLLKAGYHKLQSTSTDNSYSRSEVKNDKWHTKNIGGVYTFGAREARTQVDFGLDYSELRYDNSRRNIQGERINKNIERDAASAKLTGYYAIAPKTRLLLEGRYTDYDYKSNSDSDNNIKALLAGVTWQAAAKTKGTVKIGREKKEYKNSYNANKSTGVWEVGVEWKPIAYSTFKLTTRRGFDEGNNYREFDEIDEIDNVTSSIKTVDSSLAWKHYWLEHLYSDAEYRHTERKYQNFDRKDKVDQYSIGLTYEARRWLDVGIGFKHRDNDSDNSGGGYKRNIYALTFNASL